jgi:hypothetical protein
LGSAATDSAADEYGTPLGSLLGSAGTAAGASDTYNSPTGNVAAISSVGSASASSSSISNPSASSSSSSDGYGSPIGNPLASSDSISNAVGGSSGISDAYASPISNPEASPSSVSDGYGSPSTNPIASSSVGSDDYGSPVSNGQSGSSSISDFSSSSGLSNRQAADGYGTPSGAPISSPADAVTGSQSVTGTDSLTADNYGTPSGAPIGSNTNGPSFSAPSDSYDQPADQPLENESRPVGDGYGAPIAGTVSFLGDVPVYTPISRSPASSGAGSPYGSGYGSPLEDPIDLGTGAAEPSDSYGAEIAPNAPEGGTEPSIDDEIFASPATAASLPVEDLGTPSSAVETTDTFDEYSEEANGLDFEDGEDLASYAPSDPPQEVTPAAPTRVALAGVVELRSPAVGFLDFYPQVFIALRCRLILLARGWVEFVVQGFLCSSVVLLGGWISSLNVGLILCGPLWRMGL